MQATGQSQPRRLETENERLRRKIKEFQQREGTRETAQQKAQPGKDEQVRAAQLQQARAMQTQREKEEQARAYQLQRAHAERALQEKKSQAEQTIQKQRNDAEQTRLTQAEATRLLEEQKRKDLERLQKELDAAAAASPPPLVKSPMREKFAFFARKAGPARDTPPPTATTIASVSGSPASSVATAPRAPQESSRQLQHPVPSQAPQRAKEVPKPIERPVTSQAPKRVVEIPQQIQQGGGGIVPQIDAPISASNAGERVSLFLFSKS